MAMVIRTAEAEVAEQIAAIYAPFVTDSHTSFETEAPDGAEMARRIRESTQTHPWLVAVRGEEVLGYAYASSHRARAAYQWCVETTVYIREGSRRSGVGRRLYEALFAVLKLQGFQMAYAGVSLPNAGSVGLHEALGFTPVGVYQAAGFKLGRWHDVGWWQRAVQPLRPEPKPPVPFVDIRETERFRELLRGFSARPQL